MTIEEKAKRYDEALAKAVKIHRNYKGRVRAVDIVIEEVFPELKESEDEKIRQFLIREIEGTSDEIMSYRNMNKKDVLTWLEKQGEQKPTDNIEPKFKVGDFIVNDYCIGKVIELTSDAYLLDTEQGIPFSCEHNAHLWTIQDAKDGDVLTTDIWTFIFKKYQYKSVYYHCAFSTFNDFSISDTGEFDSDYVHPANKEQRDLLFYKMKEAGYEWDAEKKELKKIKHNSAWSEEDETILKILNELVNTTPSRDFFGSTKEKCIFWLKSLKDRVQPKQEWNDEDETYLDHIITAIKSYYTDDKGKENPWREELLRWLESLRERYTWKPSDEQMKALANALSFAKSCGEESAFDLRTLYEQLIKKLRG